MFNVPLILSTFTRPLRLLSDSKSFMSTLPKSMLPIDPKGAKSPASSLPPSSPPPEPSPEQRVQRPAPPGRRVNRNSHRAVTAHRRSISPASSVGEGPSQPRAQGHVRSASRSLPVARHPHQPIPASPPRHGPRRNPYNHSPSLHSHQTRRQAEKRRREDWEEESDDGGRRTHHRYDVVS